MIHPSLSYRLGAKIIRRRGGFTLVELLVAMGLVLLIMAILAEAFQVGLTSFRTLRAIGDMNDELRVAAGFLRRDLASDHFEGGCRLSDPNFGTASFNPANGTRLATYTGPVQGFFRVHQYGGSTIEGPNDTVPSMRSINTSGGHLLNFTVKLKGNRQKDFFSTVLPTSAAVFSNPDTFFNQPADARYLNSAAGVYRSQWAEVAYFVKPLTGAGGFQSTANGTPLFSLHRFVKLLVPRNDNSGLTAGPAPAGLDPFNGMSLNLSNANRPFNTPFDVSDPAKRGFNFTNAASLPGLGTVDNMLLTNVVSFDVQVIVAADPSKTKSGFPVMSDYAGDTTFPSPPPPAPLTGDNLVDLQDYDTGTGPKSPPLTPPAKPGTTKPNWTGLAGVQVILRVYDAKTQQTRQVTILQDL